MSELTDPRDAAVIAARAANEMKAIDVLVQKVGPFIGVTDYFVFATVRNPRQAEAVIEKMEEDLRTKAAMKPLDREISKDGSWSLLDYGPLVIHVFSQEARDYYRIEQLWSDAPFIDVRPLEGFEDMEYTDRGSALLSASEIP